ncbi:hypothetical protein DVH24_029470 [Malus domestica]|uniref:MYB transcription factor n=1 Tax=Malus domestica TaxID=3750 RepID=A0A498HVR2_MALDO|nr:hypothetical protein DVH24_029470 [Malus domestica]
MGNPKQKWTVEEEEALRAGVRKHGTGKWKDIQKDPEFNPFLSSRSNIDLKDKWRNMTVSGTGPREKSRPKTRTNQDVTVAPVSVPQTSAAAPVRCDSPAAAAPVRRDSPAAAPGGRDSPAATPVRRDAPAATPVRRDAPTETPVRRDTTPVADDSTTGLSDAIPAPVCNAMIFEALSASTDPNGLDTSAIASYIEILIFAFYNHLTSMIKLLLQQRIEVPQNFRRSLTGRLRRLVLQDKLEKIQNCYKVKTDSLSVSSDMLEESARAAAHSIAEAEYRSYLAAEQMKEAERIYFMAENTESMMQLANEILEQCSEGEVLMVA